MFTLISKTSPELTLNNECKKRILNWIIAVESYMCETRRTFPQRESHDGSPGLDAFHRAKSFGLLFSLSLSSDTLKSPELQ